MTSLLALVALIGSATARPSATFSFTTPASDAASAPLRAEADISRRAIEKFFGKPFASSVAVTIVGSRKEFDAAIPAAWGVTPSQCWMVGAGVYDRLIMLSPTAWAKDACDHKPGDMDEAKQIMRHELTHVIHGQYNPTHDFTGMDDAAWFIEGLATYVSGQLDDKRLARAQSALNSGKGPTGLADAWSGSEKYGFSGSMVAYLDKKYGRSKLISLLGKTTNAAIMQELGTTQQEFIAQWSKWLKSRKIAPHE
jgi:hypothetical protein